MSRYFTNASPEMIVPTGSTYVYDENYRAECVQIGGTKPNFPIGLTSYFYIKCRNNANDDKYVKIMIGNEDKWVVAPVMSVLERDEYGKAARFMVDFKIYRLDANAPFYENSDEVEELLMATSMYTKEDGWVLEIDTESLVDVFTEHNIYTELVDNVDYHYSEYLDLGQ